MMHATSILLLGSLLTQSAEPPVIFPTGALSRADGRVYEFSITSQINVTPPRPMTSPWRIDLIADGPFSRLDREAFQVEVNAPAGKITDDGADTIKKVTALGDAQIAVPIAQDAKFPLTVTVRGRVSCWRSVLNNDLAMKDEWPGAWPGEVRPMLSPSPLIESDAPIITEAVETLTKGDPRSVPPIQAARLLVQFACTHIQRSGSRMLWGGQRQLRGINVQGAQAAAASGEGTDADLVCVCIAMLRSAGLPARPVIGMSSGRTQHKNEFLVWGEVYIPSAGWVPFDPVELQKRTVGALDARKDWRYFGTLRELNERIPLSWAFAPGDGSTAFDAWALWGWERLAPGIDFPPAIVKSAVMTPDGPIPLGSLNAVPSQVTFTRSGKGRLQ